MIHQSHMNLKSTKYSKSSFLFYFLYNLCQSTYSLTIILFFDMRITKSQKKRLKVIIFLSNFSIYQTYQHNLRLYFLIQINPEHNSNNFSQTKLYKLNPKFTSKLYRASINSLNLQTMLKRQIQSVKYLFSKQAQLTTDNKLFGIANRMGGSSHDGLYEVYAGKFKNTAIEKFKQVYKERNKYSDPLKKYDQRYVVPGTTIITNRDQCLYCVQKLWKTKTIVAWDTETIDLDIKNETPVGKGRIIAASFFAGPQYNFGTGPRVFIDNFGQNAGLINHFKEYLQSQEYKKVWHNYGFDRHLFYNHGINVKGFGGDTMHMARLEDSSKLPGGYSLASLTAEHQTTFPLVKDSYVKLVQKQLLSKISNASVQDKQFYEQMRSNLEQYKKYFKTMEVKKTKMEQKFRRKRLLKNGQIGKTYEFPSILTLHTNEEYIKDWIKYSVLDAQSTFYLRLLIQQLLKKQLSSEYQGLQTTWKIYEKYWRPFGEVLTDMERYGFKIDLDHIANIQKQAIDKMEQKRKKFVNFITSSQKTQNIDLFNPSSCLQLQQLLFAPYNIEQQKQNIQKMKKNKQNTDEFTDQQLQLMASQSQQVKYEPKGIRKAVDLSQQEKVFKIDNNDTSRGKKKIDMIVKGFGIPAEKYTPQGLPAVDETVLHSLAGSPKEGKYGKAFDFFQLKGEQEFGKQLCQALETLLQYRGLQTLLGTFILPLKDYPDENGRIHCSLNINTQTGRLSARKPNMQNQPALEKDIFKIRKAFRAEKGNKLIVADYGQLQLRVLAHLTDCKAMITAFKQGGDFHSRTAISMYPYIKQEIQQGKLLLEWDKSKGDAPAPLLKVKYASQRKKAKTVNFSIAYGKSAKGFSEDWNCSLEEAKSVIKAWFADRPQVERWQKMKQNIAQKHKKTQTLLGRYRKLDKFFSTKNGKSMIGMRQRRAINTPIQGGAADIVIAAMVKIHYNQELKKMGWKLLMQIHDELILEGPEQTAERALEIVKYNMSHPFEEDLRIELQIDAKIGENWYECK